MEDKQGIQYEFNFKVPIKNNSIELMIDYISHKGYKASFSQSKDCLSGTLSLDMELKKEDYNILAGLPNTSIKPLSTGSENSD